MITGRVFTRATSGIAGAPKIDFRGCGRLILAATGFGAAFTLVLALFTSAPASAREQGGKTDAEEGRLLFQLNRKSLDGQKIRFENPGKWRFENDALSYSNPEGGISHAVFEADQRDYQFDAEVTIDPDAERKAGIGDSSQKRVGFFFRKGGAKEAAFFMMDRCIKTDGIEQWIAVGVLSVQDQYGGKQSVGSLAVDNIVGKHSLRAVVKGDLANFYVDGQLLSILDIAGFEGNAIGLYVENYATLHSFTIRGLTPSTELHRERPRKTDLWITPYPGVKGSKVAIEEAGRILDEAMAKKSPGITGMETMPHYTYCWGSYHDSRNSAVAFPAFHHALIIDALMKYHDYTKDIKYLDAACQLADWEIVHSTPADSAVPNMPYSTTVGGKMGGFQDADAIMLDKAGMMGLVYMSLFKRSHDDKYLEAAIKIGESLLRTQLPEGRWRNRVSPKDGTIRQDYTSNQIFDIMLMDKLEEATGEKRFAESSRKALAWLLAGPVKDYRWTGFYEDVGPTEVSIGNWDAILTARYLVAHHDENPEYLPLAKEISDWVFTTFAVKYDNKWPAICEQTLCSAPMNCHTFNYANLLVDLYEATGDESYRNVALSVARTGFDLSRQKENRGWYSLITSPLYFGIDLARKLGL